MKNVLFWLACGVLAVLLLHCLYLALPGIRPEDGTDLRCARNLDTGDAGSRAEELEVPRGAARVASVPGSDPENGPGTEDPASDHDLLARLHAVARAYAASDVETLEQNLEALLGDPRDALAVLDLLRNGRLASDPEASRGSVVTIVAGVTLYGQAGWIGPPECREYLDRVLDALPDVATPWLEQLVTGLVEARAGEHPIVGFACLPKILALRAGHPELAPIISLLLEHVADDLEATGGYEELYTLLLGETRDPTAVGISLSALLASQPDSFLPVAEEMHARARGDPELSSAITQAIAASAPVDAAASALVRMTDGSQFLEFQTLGTRDGALESLVSEYNSLAAQGDDPRARAMLVTGMGTEKEAALLGIAETDLDARVRAQAFLTGSLGRPVGPDFVRALRAAHGGRAGSRNGIDPDASVAIAENVLRASPGESRQAAREFLLEVAGDGAVADRARWKAVEALRPWVSADALRGLVIGGKAVE